MGEKDAILAELTDAEKRGIAKGSALIAVNTLHDVGMLKDPPTVLDATNRQLMSIAGCLGRPGALGLVARPEPPAVRPAEGCWPGRTLG